MRIAYGMLTLLAAAGLMAGRASAEVSGAFLIRLGSDTVGVETYTRSPSRIEIDQLLRVPQVQRRRFVYDLERDAITSVTMTTGVPGEALPLQSIQGTAEGDSLRVVIRSGGAPATTMSAWVPRGSMIIRSPIPWALYEAEWARLGQRGGDSLRTTMHFLGATARWWLRMRRLGPDSVAIANQHDDLFHVYMDRAGNIQRAVPIAGTYKVSVERVEVLDLEALAAGFSTEDRGGAGIGTLSPRDTVQAEVDGALLWVDYGRPARRGRIVYGGIVPYGELWRTGANGATQFRTDRDLDFAGRIVPAGAYSLWTVPTPTGWTLIVNSETGQWGTRHRAEYDLLRVPMKLSELPEAVERFTIGVDSAPEGGVLRFDWDTTRASAPFRVKR